jgi:curved DNA-binding protein CbpA
MPDPPTLLIAMKYKDYYQTLGLDQSATLADVKTGYRKLAHKFHPDVSKDPQGEEKFKEIAEAYATLKNPEKRQEYDDLGERAAGEEFTSPSQWQQQYGASAAVWSFQQMHVMTAVTARCLRDDFELNTPGIALDMTLVKRIEELGQELLAAQARLADSHGPDPAHH